MREQRWRLTGNDLAVIKHSRDLLAPRAIVLVKMAFARAAIWQIPRCLGSAPPALCDRLRGITRTGNLLVGCFVLGLGTWSTFASLESAAIAFGTVVSESSRKTIQHLEGASSGKFSSRTVM
jgi:HlyD family secretion protein